MRIQKAAQSPAGGTKQLSSQDSGEGQESTLSAQGRMTWEGCLKSKDLSTARRKQDRGTEGGREGIRSVRLWGCSEQPEELWWVRVAHGGSRQVRWS